MYNLNFCHFSATQFLVFCYTSNWPIDAEVYLKLSGTKEVSLLGTQKCKRPMENCLPTTSIPHFHTPWLLRNFPII